MVHPNDFMFEVQAVRNGWHTILDFLRFAWQSAYAALSSLRYPALCFEQLYRTLMGALPLAAITGIAMGAVIWMHTHTVLDRTGAGEYLPTMLSVAVLLELAPLGAGLILAARSAASIGAELSAMQNTEQIDALQVLGVSPIQRLVGPRVIAAMVAMPLLHILIASLAIGSGFLAEYYVKSTTWLHYRSAFLTGNQSELYISEVLPAALKTIVFGYLVGLAGCYFGLRTNAGTEGVGQAVTRSVEGAALFVLLSDVVMVGLIRWVASSS